MADPAAASGAQFVLKWAQERPQAVAMSEGSAQLTYFELARQVAAAVEALEAEGVRAGMIVGVECGGRMLRMVLSLACEVLGAVHVAFTAAELATPGRTVHQCQAFLVESTGKGLAAIGRVVAIDQAFVDRLQRVAATDLSRLAAGHGPDEPMRIAKTSGTTGAMKHIVKTRRMLNAAIDSYEIAMRPVAGEFTYVCLYSSAINGVYTDIVRALKFANPVRFVSSFNEIVEACRAARCYAFLLTRDAETLAAICRDASVNLDMYYADVTGSGVSPALEAALRAYVTPWIVNVYSSNETSSIAYRVQGAGEVYAVPPGIEVRIVDDAWRPVPEGSVGHICVRSALVARGYLWDEALTQRHFRDGWFLMSDLGQTPAPGKLQVVGRADDMLNIGGEKISPYPIEQRVKAVPGVSDVVLLAVENAAAVGVMCVAVEAQPDQDRAALMQRVADAMKPVGKAFMVQLEAQFPRTETGKVRRALLQAKVDAEARKVQLSPL